MNNTAPISLGICVVAALFGLVGGTMLYVMWDHTFIGAAFLGLIIALIVAFILWLGWRPANDNSRDMSAEAHRAGQAPTVPANGSGSGAAPAATPSAAAATTSSAADAAPAAASAGTAPSEATADTKADIKSTLLPGETELSERKGDWKYEGDSAEAGAGASSSAKGTAAKATAKGEDYDGDGVVEGKDEGVKPSTLSEAREGGPDNLKEIKGVGPKMEGLLHSMGFYHFDQVAAWTADEVAWVDANLEGFKGRVSRDKWVEQAKILAAGGETEFSKKVDKGGVY